MVRTEVSLFVAYVLGWNSSEALIDAVIYLRSVETGGSYIDAVELHAAVMRLLSWSL